MWVDDSGVFKTILVQVTSAFQVRTNPQTNQYELVHIRENPPGMGSYTHTLISLGRFGSLDTLSKALLEKVCLYYSPTSHEATTVTELVMYLKTVVGDIQKAISAGSIEAPKDPVPVRIQVVTQPESTAPVKGKPARFARKS